MRVIDENAMLNDYRISSSLPLEIENSNIH